MSKKTTAKKATKKTDAAEVKAAPETKVAKAAKEPKPKKEKAPKEELVVFAIRLTQAERDAIHAAAGPRGATRYVRAVAGAFAQADEAAFRSLVREAREQRA